MRQKLRSSWNKGRLFRARRIAFFSLALFAAAALRAFSADEVRLKEGKTIQGRIEKETPAEVTIRTGPNMYLRVERSKISEIIREKKAAPRAFVTLQRSTSTASVAAASPRAAPEIRHLLFGATTWNLKTDNVELAAAVATSALLLNGKLPEEIRGDLKEKRANAASAPLETASIVGLVYEWTGTSLSDGNVRRWKNLQAKAAFTVTGPDWQAPKKPAAATVAWWNDFLTTVQKHDQDHLAIYRSSFEDAVQALAALRADDESRLRSETDKILAQAKVRAIRRMEGYDRHLSALPIVVKKASLRPKPRT